MIVLELSNKNFKADVIFKKCQQSITNILETNESIGSFIKEPESLSKEINDIKKNHIENVKLKKNNTPPTRWW
jgi:hypothetical protein